MTAETKKEKSKWEQTLKTYRKFKEEDRLDEIELVPDEMHERVSNMVESVVNLDYLQSGI